MADASEKTGDVAGVRTAPPGTYLDAIRRVVHAALQPQFDPRERSPLGPFLEQSVRGFYRPVPGAPYTRSEMWVRAISLALDRELRLAVREFPLTYFEDSAARGQTWDAFCRWVNRNKVV